MDTTSSRGRGDGGGGGGWWWWWRWGGLREGEERIEGSLVEFTHHITAANRNPQSISDIFIIPVKFY